MLKGKFAHKRANSLTSVAGNDTVRVIVGKESREFIVPKRLLASTSGYFHQRLDTSSLGFVHRHAQLNVLWLEDLCPNMFDLFTYWLYKRNDFKTLIELAEEDDALEDFHWDLVNLHLFAARIGLDKLQDITMDAIQDIHLQCNWEINSQLVTYIYTECNPDESYRMRKWIVAMTAWTLEGDMDVAMGDTVGGLFKKCPELWEDYVSHLSKVSKSRIRLQFKNPQLRLPSNDLRNEERQFGFRQCSFHTHRSAVGQGRCPHTLPQSRMAQPDQHLKPPPPSKVDQSIVSPTTAIFDLYLDLY